MSGFTPWDVSTVKVERAEDGKLSISGLSPDQLWTVLQSLLRATDDSASQERTDDLALMFQINKSRMEVGA